MTCAPSYVAQDWLIGVCVVMFIIAAAILWIANR